MRTLFYPFVPPTFWEFQASSLRKEGVLTWRPHFPHVCGAQNWRYFVRSNVVRRAVADELERVGVRYELLPGACYPGLGGRKLASERLAKPLPEGRTQTFAAKGKVRPRLEGTMPAPAATQLSKAGAKKRALSKRQLVSYIRTVFRIAELCSVPG